MYISFGPSAQHDLTCTYKVMKDRWSDELQIQIWPDGTQRVNNRPTTLLMTPAEAEKLATKIFLAVDVEVR